MKYDPLYTSDDLDPLMDRIGNAKFVLLGEASHGTHEYYTWRAEISKRLIMEKGFSFIAVEGDWPDCFKINRWVKGNDVINKYSQDVLKTFSRWPTWMWSNWETAAFMEWIKNYNESFHVHKKIGFYGLDVYSLSESIQTIMYYLQKEDPATAAIAKRAIECFEPLDKKFSQARSLNILSAGCKKEVVRLLKEVRKKAPGYKGDLEAGLNAEINALVAANAERYYSSMVSFSENSWNIRDAHMMETLNSLISFHGKEAKAIIWAHNSHIGDARATDMAKDGLHNIGQLVRDQHDPDGVILVGFGSYKGTVVAGNAWEASMQVMQVPPAKINSLEEILHREDPKNKLLIFADNLPLFTPLKGWLGHRAIGVVYSSERDQRNYVPTKLTSRYDAFIFIDETKALQPILKKTDPHLMPETYPFGT